MQPRTNEKKESREEPLAALRQQAAAAIEPVLVSYLKLAIRPSRGRVRRAVMRRFIVRLLKLELLDADILSRAVREWQKVA